MSRQAVLRKLIEAAGDAADDSYILALSSEGLEDLPGEIQTARGTFIVQRPSTELGLRRLIWKANGAPLVAVIDRELALRLPPDLIRRARGRRTK